MTKESTGIWHYVADFQSRLLLTIFYFTILVPFALIVRMFLHPLRARTKSPTSGWVARPAETDGLARARRQF